MSGLLERGEELARIDALLAGDAGALLVEGPAGIGKTALLDEARRRARDSGRQVLAARGGELEREFAHAGVRQLFEPALLEPGDRTELLAGAAALAAPVVAPAPGSPPTLVGDPGFAVAHGLYWLTANLARRGPLAIVVDDAHWCDRPTLAFLLYLLRRLDGLPVLIIAAARPAEGGAEELGQLAAERRTRVLTPAPLSVGGVAELVTSRLGDADERFILACHDATGGNPFLAAELLAALVRDGIAPTAANADAVGALGPAAVRRAITLRLGRLPEAAGRLARAAAVLGDGSQLRHATALAGIEDAGALDALTATQILAPRLPLEFVHPIVRAAVYEDLTPAARARLHAAAARLLDADRADPEQVAAHLLATEPAGAAWAAAALAEAAAAAVPRGAPEAARLYLERALAELPGDEELLYELGRVEALQRDPAALAHLQEALRVSEDPAFRARVAEELTALLLFAGQWDATGPLLERTLDELGDADDAAATRLETLRAATALYDPRLVDEYDRGAERLEALAARGGPAARATLAVLGAAASWRAEPGGRELLLRALDGGRLLADEGAESWFFGQIASGLVGLDELDAVDALSAAMLEDGSRRGSVLGTSAAASFAGFAQARRGLLREAEASLRLGFRLATEHGLTFGLPSIFWYSIDVVAERPGLADVGAAALTLELPPPFDGTASGGMIMEARGHLRSERADAIADLRRCGELYTATRLANPITSAWRSALALALRRDDPDEAAALVAEELRLARALGLPRGIGAALRVQGLLTGDIELLREAVATLRRAPAAYEQARALADLGAALRRSGRRADARAPLREALELARRCGAERLTASAEQELRAAGAKPRRLAFSGVESLTASELRIAELAAGGMSNQQVAEALFVTAKTVENHLGRVYQKLGIHSRDKLAEALQR